MRAGRLRHRLVIEEPVSVRTSTGAERVEWRAFAEVWAAIEPIRGKEQEQSGQLLGDVDTKVFVRWSPKMAHVAAKWRLRHAERRMPTTYDVIGHPVHVALNQREIQFACRSGVNRG